MFRRWPFEFSPNVLSTPKPQLDSSTYRSAQREHLAFHESTSGSECAAPDRVVREAPVRIPPHSVPTELARLRVRLPRRRRDRPQDAVPHCQNHRVAPGGSVVPVRRPNTRDERPTPLYHAGRRWSAPSPSSAAWLVQSASRIQASGPLRPWRSAGPTCRQRPATRHLWGSRTPYPNRPVPLPPASRYSFRSRGNAAWGNPDCYVRRDLSSTVAGPHPSGLRISARAIDLPPRAAARASDIRIQPPTSQGPRV